MTSRSTPAVFDTLRGAEVRPLRIALGAIHLGHAGTGVGAVVVAQANQLFEAGHDVTLLAGDCPDAQGLPQTREAEGRKLSIKLFPIASPWNRRLYRAPALRPWLRAHIGEFDLLDIHGIWSLFALDIAAACRRHGVPYLFTPHGQMTRWDWGKAPIKKKLFFSLMMENLWESASAIRFVSHDEASRSMVHANGRKIVIPNFVAAPPEGDFASASARLKRKLSIPEDASVVLFLGRIDAQKGVLELLDAFDKAWQRRRDLVLMIVGEIDSPYAKAVAEKADTLSCSPSIRFAGPLFGEEKEAAFAGAALFVTLSKAEGLPLTVLEAMSRSLPVLLTEESNLSLVADYAAGSIHKGPQDAATSLLDMLSDADRLRQMGLNAKRLFAENFSAHTIMPRLFSLYDRIARQRHCDSDVTRVLGGLS